MRSVKFNIDKFSEVIQPDSPINKIPDKIPDEILHHTFSFFVASQLAKLSRVCRRWKSVSTDQHLWQPILEKRWPVIFQNIRREYSYFLFYKSQMQTISFLSKKQPLLEHSFPVDNFPIMKADQNCMDLIKDKFDPKKWYSERGGRIKILSAIRNVDLILLNFRL